MLFQQYSKKKKKQQITGKQEIKNKNNKTQINKSNCCTIFQHYETTVP